MTTKAPATTAKAYGAFFDIIVAAFLMAIGVGLWYAGRTLRSPRLSLSA